MNKLWGELANKMSTVVEDIVAPSIQRLTREVFDCGERQYFGTRVSLTRSDDRSREREFDALYVGTRAVLLNETKSSPRMSDAQAFARFLESGEFARHAGAQGFVHPALDGEVRDAGKLVDVAGDQRRPRRPGMSGDQKVIVADRGTDPLQFGMGAAVGRRRLCVCVRRLCRVLLTEHPGRIARGLHGRREGASLGVFGAVG